MPKPSSTETGAQRPSALEMFTDRVHEQELLQEILRPVPTTPEHPELFLTVFYGVGGVGKSTLCRRAHEIAAQQASKDVVLATVDYDSSNWSTGTAFANVASELVRCLAEKGIAPRLSGALLALYSRSSSEAVSPEAGWELAMDTLDKGAELAGIPGLGMVLKGVKWVRDRAQQAALQRQLRDLHLWPEERYGRVDLLDLEAKIGRAVFEDVRGWLTDNPARHLRLLVDGFERLQSHERKADAQKHLQDFLGYFAASQDRTTCGRFRALIFGREKLRWDELYEDEDWHRFWNQHLLAGLAEQDARDFLRRYQRWFRSHGQQALADALSQCEGRILDATDERAAGERMFYPFYLNLAVELLERSVLHGTMPEFGQAPAELQDRFFKYLDPAELRTLMVLSLAETFDEHLYDWLANERVIELPVHAFHTRVRREHSYFQTMESSPDSWRFHRIFEGALQSRWLVGESERKEGQAVTRRLIGYYSDALAKVPERDWSEREVELWRRGMEIIVTQGPEKEAFEQTEWTSFLKDEPWANEQYLCTELNTGFTKRVTAQIERIFGPEHLYTLSLVNSLGNLLCKKGDYDGAEAMYRRALEAGEKLLGPEHSYMLSLGNNFGNLLYSKGDYDGAEAMYRRALEAGEKLLGPEHRDTLTLANGLGNLLCKKGDYDGAEALYRRALEAGEKLLGPEHPDTLGFISNLGSLLREKGDYDGAEVLIRRALEAAEELLGSEHPDTLICVSELAGLLYQKGDYNGAEAKCRRVLEAREKLLGLTHPHTLGTVANLGRLLREKGDYDGAEVLIRRGLEAREKLLGLTHPDTLSSIHNLGELHMSKGDHGMAESIFRRALEGWEKVLGPEHPNTLLGLRSLAKLEEQMGDQAREQNDLICAGTYFEKALLHWQKLEVISKDTINHPGAAIAHERLGDMALIEGNFEAAHSHFAAALMRWQSMLTSVPQSAINRRGAALIVERLAETLCALDKAEEAVRLCKRIIHPLEDSPEHEHLDTLDAIRNAGSFLKRAGRVDAAAELLRDWMRVSPQEGIRYNLACYECLLGNFDEARRLLVFEFADEPSRLEFALKDDDLMALHSELPSLTKQPVNCQSGT
jgi:tetratricopeptide (TPR) repeat protein